ncbi:MAG: rhodanese-like domain-containing protein [Lewinella sp.]|nr:rhodanese-like domain-containing protein [Lewinella sp.]
MASYLKIILLFLLLGSWSLFSALAAQASDSTLIGLLTDGARLIDVRSPAEFAIGAVPGSVNIPLDSLAQYQGWLAQQPHLIVYCQAGGRSARAQQWLLQRGIKGVTNAGAYQRVAALVPPRIAP